MKIQLYIKNYTKLSEIPASSRLRVKLELGAPHAFYYQVRDSILDLQLAGDPQKGGCFALHMNTYAIHLNNLCSSSTKVQRRNGFSPLLHLPC